MINRLIAVGDIHGCFEAFHTLIVDKIQITKEDRIILLGDYIDRGSQSKEVIDYIIGLLKSGFDIKLLLGNHERMLLDAYSNDEDLPKWILNGGDATINSFGIKSLKDLNERYLNFFVSLLSYHLTDDYLFVHAGFNDDINNPFEDRLSMIWNCRENYTNPSLRNKTIIHGHCPITTNSCQERVHNRQKVIDIDWKSRPN